MELTQYTPVSRLVATTTPISRPRFTVIDAHNHLGGGLTTSDGFSAGEVLAGMDASGVRILVDLDGGWGEDILDAHLALFKQAAPERFVMFGGVNWETWQEQGNRFGEWAAGRMRLQAERGAQGLKVWKGLGLSVRDHDGVLVAVDDRRLDPIWETAAELGWPVLIHVADPVAFFDPLDHNNERWEELQAHPDWQFPSPPFPPFLSVVNGMATVAQRHPHTTFIGAHVGCYSENLAWVGALLDRCPNFNVDIAARISELGRQPYSARRFSCAMLTGSSSAQTTVPCWTGIVSTIASLRRTTSISRMAAGRSPHKAAGRSMACTCLTMCCARSIMTMPKG